MCCAAVLRQVLATDDRKYFTELKGRYGERLVGAGDGCETRD